MIWEYPHFRKPPQNDTDYRYNIIMIILYEKTSRNSTFMETAPSADLARTWTRAATATRPPPCGGAVVEMDEIWKELKVKLEI